MPDPTQDNLNRAPASARREDAERAAGAEGDGVVDAADPDAAARASSATVPDGNQAAQAPAGAGSSARAAAVVMVAILASRLVGLARQRVMAHWFGTSAFADVIAAAFRVGNITQNLLGEGTLSASFIPVYARLRAQGKHREAAHFALSALGLLLLTVVALSVIGALAAPWITGLIAAGFDADRYQATVRMVRITFPMTGLLVIGAWGLGVLTSHRRFLLPYAAPVLWNLAQIAALGVAGSWLAWRGGALAMALAWGALLGAFLQVAVLLPAVRGLLGGLAPRFDHGDVSLREAARRLPGALLGRGVIQLSGLIDTALVSFLGTGANAVVGYAQMIYLLPMSLLGTGEAAVALPALAGDTAERDLQRRNAAMRDRLGRSLARVATLTVPSAVALVVFGRELCALLLQTGSFDREARSRVVPVLATYGVALLANASGRVLGTTLYALGDTQTPARYAFVRVVFSTALSVALMGPLGVVGVVAGAVAAAWVEAALLARKVRSVIGDGAGGFGLGLEHVPFVRVVLGGAVPGLAGLGARSLLVPWLGDGPLGAFAVLAVFGSVFLAMLPLLGLANLRSLMRRRG